MPPALTEELSAPLAELTDQGRQQFEKLLAISPSLPLREVMTNLARIATSEKLSVPVRGARKVRLFPELATRLDTARWVESVLAGSDVRIGPGQASDRVFTWLAMVALPSLCKRTRSDRLDVRDSERYVQKREERAFYRHLVSGPYWLHHRHGERARLLLCQPAHEMPDVVEQVVSRWWLRESTAVMELLDCLYWDPKAGAPKPGYTTTDRLEEAPPGMGRTVPRPGTVRALEALLGQLQCTHDLQSMTVEQLLALLPGEFEHWLRGSRAGRGWTS